MKKVIALAFLMVAASAARAQYYAIPVQLCGNTATQAFVSGLQSTNYLAGVIRGCTVTVYLTGTSTKAVLYSNATGSTLGNPFTADLLTGKFLAFAANGQGYDVVLSGGGANPSCTTTPNCYAATLTITDIFAGGGSGGGMVWPTFTGLAKYGGSSNWITPTYADVVALFSGGSCTGYLKSDGTCSTGGGNAPSVVATGTPSVRSGSVTGYDGIPVITPDCDIRSQGAVIDAATPIDSAVQACVNLVNSQYGSTGTVLLPCVRQNSTGAGCYWANPSALTGPAAGRVKFVVQGGIQVGSTFTAQSWADVVGEGGGGELQFQSGTDPANIFGSGCNGTLGTAVTAANTATNITIGISGSVYGGGPSCAIANLPVGSAITTGGVRSSSATAVRTGTGQTTYTLASSQPRIPAGEIATIAGCSDSSLNVANIAVSESDYTAQTVTVFQTSTTPTTGTGCTVTGFSEDLFESARILCSNGTSGTFNSVTYSACGAGQVTIMLKRAHLSTDSWGTVVAGPAFNNYEGQLWDGINIYYGTGMGFWGEGNTNLTFQNGGVQSGTNLTSGAMQLSANYLSHLKNVTLQAATPAHLCTGGGCSQGGYPFALLCDADATVGGYYSAGTEACDNTVIDGVNWLVDGGIRLGDGAYQITGVPQISNLNVEEPWVYMIAVDNRLGVQDANNCLSVDGAYAQDNISGWMPSLLGYTDSEAPAGCASVSNLAQAQATLVANKYFNGRLSMKDIPTTTTAASVLNNTAPSPTYNEGHLIDSEIANEGAGFGPQIVPYASLPMTSYSVSAWNALCVTAGNCTVTAVPGPDGPSGQMVTGDMVTSASFNTDADIVISTDTRNIYQGDRYIIGVTARPGSGTNQNSVSGYVNNTFVRTPIYISSGLNFALTGTAGIHTCDPSTFSTGIYRNGYSPQVGVCEFTSGTGSSTTISFHLTTSNASTSYAWDNQIAEPFWVFIPGPNNPACTAAKTCNLTADQIEEARRDQYHGCVPPGTAAGNLATCESGASGSGNMSDGSGSSTAGYFPATTSTAHTYLVDTNIDDGVTTASTVTVHEALAVNCTSCASQANLTYNSGHAPSPGSSTTAEWAPSTAGLFMISEAGGAFAEACTSTNGVCASPVATIISSGAITVTAQNTYIICTANCTITPLPPALNVQLCVRNGPDTGAVVTLAALGSGKSYELTDHTTFGTANHAVVSPGSAYDESCWIGYSTTQYANWNSSVPWVD